MGHPPIGSLAACARRHAPWWWIPDSGDGQRSRLRCRFVFRRALQRARSQASDG
jgi:hypothetical protein